MLLWSMKAVFSILQEGGVRRGWSSPLLFLLSSWWQSLGKAVCLQRQGRGNEPGDTTAIKSNNKCIWVPEMQKQQIICYMEQDSSKSLVFYSIAHLQKTLTRHRDNPFFFVCLKWSLISVKHKCLSGKICYSQDMRAPDTRTGQQELYKETSGGYWSKYCWFRCLLNFLEDLTLLWKLKGSCLCGKHWHVEREWIDDPKL